MTQAAAAARMRILFVDDEPRVLDGMRRMLHPLRHAWDMEFLASGHAALDRLRAADTPAVDVVVSDMRMPDMDGSELLEIVRVEQPRAVRLILSGHADPHAVMRSINRTHQYLAKPCDPELLRTTIERALRLRELLSDPVIQRLAGGVGTLPSVPAVYHDLVASLRSSQASLVDVGRLIARDVAMTAKVLQLVNSAYFGLPRKVTSAERAAALLGIDTLMALVLGHGLFSAARLPPGATLRVADLWEHSLATAAAARSIAAQLGFDVPHQEHAFLAGMLHDCGALLLAAGMPEAYHEALTVVTVHAGEADAERAAFGASHAEVGAYLLGIWGLPEPVVAAVAWHEQPAASGGGVDLAAIVHLADRLVTAADPAVAPDDPALGLAPDLLENSGLVPRFADLAARVAALREPPA